MSSFSAKKLNPSELNNGNEYTKDDRLSLEVLNGLVNSALYSQGIVDNIANMGSYLSTTTYKILNIVTYNGSSYIAIKDDFSDKLPTNTDYWKLIAEKGDKGNTGDTPSIKIGNVTSSPTGQTSVTNSGTPTSPTLNFQLAGFTRSLNTIWATVQYGKEYELFTSFTVENAIYSTAGVNKYRISTCEIDLSKISPYKSLTIADYDWANKEITPILTNTEATNYSTYADEYRITVYRDAGQINLVHEDGTSSNFPSTSKLKLLVFIKE